MKNKIFIGLIAVVLSLSVLPGCNNADQNNKTTAKELELLKRELDLKQKELEIKEKVLSQQQNQDNSKTKDEVNKSKPVSKSQSQIQPILKVDKTADDIGVKFIGKWTEDDYEIFTIRKTGEKFHIESNILWDGAKTEWTAKLVNGELVGRPVDDGTGGNTIITIAGAKLRITNLFGNNKILHKSK